MKISHFLPRTQAHKHTLPNTIANLSLAASVMHQQQQQQQCLVNECVMERVNKGREEDQIGLGGLPDWLPSASGDLDQHHHHHHQLQQPAVENKTTTVRIQLSARVASV